MILHAKIANEPVVINALPPGELAEPLWERWLRHVEKFEDSIVGLDTETTAIDEVLGPFEPDARERLIQFGSRRYAWVLDPHDPVWRKKISALLDSGTYRFVTHSDFDVLWAGREFGIPADDRWIDTLPMACLLYPGVTEDKDLKALCTELIDPALAETAEKLYEHFRDLAPVGFRQGKKTPRQWGFTNIPLDDKIFCLYAGLDAICVRRLLDVLAGLIKKTTMAKLSRREQKIQRWSTQIRQRGQLVDRDWMHSVIDEISGDYEQAQDWILDNIGCKPLSPQRAWWLQDRGVTFHKFTPQGQPQLTMPSAASEGTLPQLYERYAHDPELEPALNAMLTIGTHKNLITNLRIIDAQSANDGRVHPQIRTQAAHTGRQSIIKPAMQTFKKRDLGAVQMDEGKFSRLRGCFIADDGMALVGADYASQEVRIAAAYSQDATLLRVVHEDLNQHLETARLVFGVEDKMTVRNPVTGQTFYDCSKTMDFALQFGARPKRIAEQLGISLDEAAEMHSRWQHAYAGFVEWFDAIAEAEAIVNPWGRVIPSDPWRGYANANYAIQSTGRDVLGEAMERLADDGWAPYFWLTMHDELILQVPEEMAEQAAEAMTILMSTKIRNVELPAKGQIIGKRWGSADD